MLAGATIAGWWLFDARHQPVHVRRVAIVEAALGKAPSVVLREGTRPVYVVGPRGHADWEQWAVNEGRLLAGLGREVRAVVVSSGYGGVAEEATVAQLWLNPDKRLLAQWLERPAELWTAAGLPSLRSDPLRQEALARSAGFASVLGNETGAHGRWPLVLWHDPSGALVVCVCDTPQAQIRARRTLGISGQAQTIAPLQNKDATPHREQTSTASMPYPVGQAVIEANPLSLEAYNEPAEAPYASGTITPSPLLPGDAVATTPKPGTVRVAPASAPTRSRSQPKVVNTAPPEARKDAEALFF